MLDLDSRAIVSIAESSEEEGWPSWSPDGRRVTFFIGRDGDFEIYESAADGSQPRNLTLNPARDFGPAWSPRGSQIAFVSDRDGGEDIYLLNLDQENIIRLTFGGRSAPIEP